MNDLGNLLQRTVSMIQRYRSGLVAGLPPAPGTPLGAAAEPLPGALHRALGAGWDPREGLRAVLSLVGVANRLVDEAKPWVLELPRFGGG